MTFIVSFLFGEEENAWRQHDMPLDAHKHANAEYYSCERYAAAVFALAT
jgi:hypothetical protein